MKPLYFVIYHHYSLTSFSVFSLLDYFRSLKVHLKKSTLTFKDSEREEDEYDVEYVVDYSWCKEQCQGLYFVKWKGYDASQNTWEPLEHLECHEKLKEFYALRLKEREKALPGRYDSLL